MIKYFAHSICWDWEKFIQIMNNPYENKNSHNIYKKKLSKLVFILLQSVKDTKQTDDIS